MPISTPSSPGWTAAATHGSHKGTPGLHSAPAWGLGLVPGLPLGVQGAAVVDNPPIYRPGKGPAGIEPQAGGILGSPGRGFVILLVRTGINTRVYPAAAGGGAVVFQTQEVGHLL